MPLGTAGGVPSSTQSIAGNDAGSSMTRTATVQSSLGPASAGSAKASANRPHQFLLFHSIPFNQCFSLQAGTNGDTFTSELFTESSICLVGFTAPAQIHVTGPDGREEQIAVPSDNTWIMSPASNSLLGTYRVEASDSSGNQASADNNVVLPRYPHTLAEASSVARGGALHVQYAGFSVGTRVDMAVFGPIQKDGSYPIFADLPSQNVDPTGVGTVTWTAPRGAAASRYVLVFGDAAYKLAATPTVTCSDTDTNCSDVPFTITP
jgi:hypothetical protein